MTEPLTFAALGVARDLVEQLASLGITTPTPIQAQAIPEAMAGRDVIGIAQTGTGKTLAFGLPILARLSKSRSQALILVPTRELADQAEASLRAVAHKFGLRTALLIGGAPMNRQRESIRRRPHVILATPGRLLDHLEQRFIRLDAITILVLDEADRMLDMGFAPQVNQILAAVPTQRQTMLFSATMPPSIQELSRRTLHDPVTVSVTPSGTTVDRIDQSLIVMERAAKPNQLKRLLQEISGPALVFTRTKHGAKKLCSIVSQFGFSAAEIHGNRSLPQRRLALAGFKSGHFRVLVATDIAARGIDVTGISLVVNYDLPEQAEEYVHRIGRTARAGLTGRAISFVEPNQGGDLRAIERLIGRSIPRATGSAQLSSSAAPSHSRRQGGGQPSRGQRGDLSRTGRSRYAQHRRSSDPRSQSTPNPTVSPPATHASWVHTPGRPSTVINPVIAPARPIDPTSPFLI